MNYLEKDQVNHLRNLINTCVRSARINNRNILDLHHGALPSTGWTIANEIKEYRVLIKESMALAREYKREISTMMTPIKKIEATLKSSGIPYKEINCYGSQIVVTSWSMNAAERWATLLSSFCTLRVGCLETFDNAKDQTKPTKHRWVVKGTIKVKVYRTFARL